jgi:hypothetical protein
MNSKACPQCGGAATNITPVKSKQELIAVYACPACGYAFKANGGAFVENPEKLQDVFRGATLGKQTLMEVMAGEKLNPATQALFAARLMEYGLQMWMDGLKQGVMLGAIKQDREIKNGNE